MSFRRTSNNLAAINLLFAATLWGLMWLPLRYFHQQGVDGLWSSTVAYFFAMLVGLVMMRNHWGELRIASGRLLFIALAAGWCNVSFIIAVAEKDAARVVLLFYLSPVWSIILGIIFLHEKPNLTAVIISVFAIIGALLMLWNPADASLWPRDVNDWLALSSGFSFSVANALVRNATQVSIATKAFATWWGVIIIGVVSIIIFQHPLPNVGVSIWAGIALLGLVGIVAVTVTVQYGVSKLPLYKSAIILLFEVVVTVLSSQLLSDERLSTLAWTGGSLIVAATMVSALSGEISKLRKNKFTP